MMSRAALATLASEIEQSRPILEWDAVPELKKFRQEIKTKDGSKHKMAFSDIVIAYRNLDSEIKFREEKKAELREALEAAMALADEQQVLAEGYKVSLVTRAGSKKIVPEKLLGLGVSAMVIAQATEQGKESTFITVKRAKED